MSKEIKLSIKIPDFQDFKRKFDFLSEKLVKYFVKIIKFARKKIWQGLIHAKNDIKQKKVRFVFVIIISVIFFWQVSLNAGLFWFLFLIFLFYGWENRIIASLALISLASCPFLLIAKKEYLAEKMAIYAYYFLVMTVILQIIEYKHELKMNRSYENESL